MAKSGVDVGWLKSVSFLMLVLLSQSGFVNAKVTFETPDERSLGTVNLDANNKTLVDFNGKVTVDYVSSNLTKLVKVGSTFSESNLRSGLDARRNSTDSKSGKLEDFGTVVIKNDFLVNPTEEIKSNVEFIDLAKADKNVKLSQTERFDKEKEHFPVNDKEELIKNQNLKYRDVAPGSLAPSANDNLHHQYQLRPSNKEAIRSLETGASAEINDLEWLLNVYNPLRWRTILPTHFSTECRADMEEFLINLNKGVPWAARMSDASGRYSSQFFFGNNFWLGSQSLCEELQNNLTNFVLPPFRVRFNVLKLHISLTKELTPSSRLIFLGVCLPNVCSPEDVRSLMKHDEASSLDTPNRKLDVISVRPVPGDYILLADPKFHIIGGVTAVVAFFMILGTTYETMLMYRTPRKKTNKVPDLEEKGGDNNNETVDSKMTLAEKKKKNHTDEPGLLGQCMLSFSIISNGCKILNCSTPEDSLTSIHGLRFLSLAWVIMVHTYLQVFGIAENKVLRTVTERNFMFQTISNATFSVDTFFFISGLLVTFLYFKSIINKETEEVDKSHHTFKKSSIKFLTLVFYRFIRLTPAYLFVLGLVELSVRYLKNNSVFEPQVFDDVNCRDYWWRNALYINSLFPRKDMCMLWSWYMANDTQFYILGISMLLLAVNYFRYVAAVFGVFMVSSWFTTGYVALHNQYQARVQEPFALFDELYDKPWTRLGPYLVGMVTGYILFKTKCRIRIPMAGVLVGWVLSLSCLLSLVYGLLHVQLDVPTSAAYVALGHTAWGVALGWIVVACCTGYGGIINIVLSFRALYPLSRLTYCAYLVHPMVMVLTSFQMDGPLHLHNMLVMILYLGNVVASFFLSFLISLAFEAPVVRLLKISMSSGNKKKS